MLRDVFSYKKQINSWSLRGSANTGAKPRAGVGSCVGSALKHSRVPTTHPTARRGHVWGQESVHSALTAAASAREKAGTLWGWLIKWEPAQTTRAPSQDRLCLALTAGTREFSTCALKEAHGFTSVSSQSVCCSWSLKGLLVSRMSPVTGQGSSDGRAGLVGFVSQLWVEGVIQPWDLVQSQKHAHLKWLLWAVHKLKPELISYCLSLQHGDGPWMFSACLVGVSLIFVFPPLLIGTAVICTDWTLETADPLSAVQLLLSLGWKVTPGAHRDTATSLCSAKFTPCLLCCGVRNAGTATRLPSATLLGHTPLQREAQMQPGTIWQQPPAPACSNPSTGDQPLSCLLRASGSWDRGVWSWDPHRGAPLLGAACAGQAAPAPAGAALAAEQDAQPWRHSPL